MGPVSAWDRSGTGMLQGAPASALGLLSGRWVWENPDPASSGVCRGDSPILSGVGVEGWRGISLSQTRGRGWPPVLAHFKCGKEAPCASPEHPRQLAWILDFCSHGCQCPCQGPRSCLSR